MKIWGRRLWELAYRTKSNDQVTYGMRLWLRDRLREIEEHLVAFLRVMTSRVKYGIDVLMPGYTHLQRAQPIRRSRWILSYGSAFVTHLERLRDVIKRVDCSPLGLGALVGNPFDIDRDAIVEDLGFDGTINNSMATVADRDFVLEALQWSANLMQHILRGSEDLILYSTAEFGFVRVADAYSTGTSLMPQNKNSDYLELFHGKSGGVFGQMAGLMMSA